MKPTRNEWIALGMMVAIYTLCYLPTHEPFIRHYLQLSRKSLHLLNFVGIVLVYLVGLLALRPKHGWMLRTWNLAHAILIPALLALSLSDYAQGGLSLGLRHLAQSLAEVLLSPLLFGALLLLQSLANHPGNSR